ncbi:aromatic amino acid transport family protein [Patescibacteria group bacterium]
MGRLFNQTVSAIATLAGTIIGVGLFALPYAASKAGLWIMIFYFIILSIVVIFTHLMFGEVILRTKDICRLPGYVNKYLGSGAKIIAFFVAILGISGALLAYLIVGGGFLFSLFGPYFGGANFVYVLAFFLFGALLIYTGIKDISKTEFFLLACFFIVLMAIFFKGFSLINMKYLFNFDNYNIKNFFFPYGPILFSLSGLSLVPEIREMLTENPKNLKKVIIISILIASLTYLFFIFLILGLTGPQTSVEAISGLKNIFGDGLVILAFALGVLTTFTSFIALGLTLKKIFWYDMHIRKNVSWALACFIPFALYTFGLKDFIAVISLTGAIALGASAILVAFIYLKAKNKGDKIPAYNLCLPSFFVYLIAFMFFLGIIYQIWYFVV